MTTSQIFNTSRFGKYLRLYISENGKQLGLYALFVPIALTLLMILPDLTDKFSDYSNEVYDRWGCFMNGHDPRWSWVMACTIFAFSVFITLVGNIFYQAMHGKNRRYVTLSLPVSNFEKWLTWFVVYVIGFLAVFVLSFYCADAIRVLLVKIFADHSEMASMFPVSRELDKLLKLENNIGYFAILMYLSVALLSVGMFTLGSIVWSKSHFFKTLASLALLQFVVVIVCSSACMTIAMDGDFRLRWDFEEYSLSYLAYSYALLAVIYVFITWLAYARFKDSELVNRW